MVEPTTRYAAPADLARVESSDPSYDGVLFLARLPDGPIHHLNGAAAIVHDVAPGRSAEEVVTAVAQAVGLDPARVDADVRACLADLEALGLIDRVETPPEERVTGG